jgi:hypothetical protein
MINFMVLGLPRSGTAWLANLLTTQKSYCRHEALWTSSLDELNKENHTVGFGIAETSGFSIVDQINAHNAKKLIVRRDLSEINESLQKLGIPKMNQEHMDKLLSISGYHIDFKDIFDYDKMAKAYDFLLHGFLEPYRHEFLCDMNIQNQKLIKEIQRIF